MTDEVKDKEEVEEVEEEEDPDLEGLDERLVKAIKEDDEDRDLVLQLVKQYSEDVVIAALEAGVQLCDVEEAYAGKFDSDEEFAQDLVEQVGDLPKDLPWYIHIDWEWTAREIMMDYSDANGHYFRNF